MAKQKPKLPQLKEPEFLHTYGLPEGRPGGQLTYDRAAFAGKIPMERGTPSRYELFKRIADQVLPGYFEWHEWTERKIRAMTDNQDKQTHLVAMPGCSSCVAGHTRIFNPITGECPTIEELHEQRKAPVVMTLRGAVQAEVPFIKGITELFEVRLSNGHVFQATGHHRVRMSLTNGSTSWCRVDSLKISQCLLSYEPIHRRSTLESSRATHERDALYSQRITVDSLDGCHSLCRSYDEPLPLDQDTFRSLPPSQADVQTRIQHHSHAGDFSSEDKYSLIYQHACLLSNCDDVLHHNSWGTSDQRHDDSETTEHAFPLYQSPERSHSKATHPGPFQEQILCSIHTGLMLGAAFHAEMGLSTSQGIPYNGFMVSLTRVVSIRKTEPQIYYDITVPEIHHYFAEGAIHHNSGKTHDIAGFAVAWWLCEPENSSVMFVSTTIKALRQRGWAEIQKCNTTIPGPRFGNFVDSKMMWQATRGDDRHAIFGKAVEQGSTAKVADDIKGVHAMRQLVVIDEANQIPEAIWDACTNLYSYPKEFLIVAMANPRSRLERFSRFMEPKDGWTSVTVDDEEWEGRPQIDYGGAVTQVVRFDAEKSPNVIKGYVVSSHLPTIERVERARKNAGGGNTPNYWTNERGFPPPEGMTKTVFSESVLISNDASGKLIFAGGDITILGAFDPAFGGGDRPAIRFAKMGTIIGYKMGIQLFPPIVVPLDMGTKNTIDFQLVEAAKRFCAGFVVDGVTYVCHPENFAIDATGRGAATLSIAQRMWSAKLMGVDFGSSASEDQINLEDVRPAKDVYRNKRAEMWFRLRDGVSHNQIKGIDAETAVELCNMEFEDMSDDGISKKTVLMSKKEYKLKFGKSPDFSDTAAIITEIARRRGFRLAAIGETATKSEEWNKVVLQAQSVYGSVDYAASNDVEEYYMQT